MGERMRFVILLNDVGTMAWLCREFGISRKTGYKTFERYQQCGLEGLIDRVRRPYQLLRRVDPAIPQACVDKDEIGKMAARKI